MMLKESNYNSYRLLNFYLLGVTLAKNHKILIKVDDFILNL